MRNLVVAATVLSTVFVDGHVDGTFVKSLYRTGKLMNSVSQNQDENQIPTRAVQLPAFLENQGHRHLVDQMSCDQSFMNCMPVVNCVSCFGSLQTNNIDWASVAPNTPCRDVVEFLETRNYCTALKSDKNALEVFCNTFDTCVVWDDYPDDGNRNNPSDTNGTSVIDCSTLKDCNWPGFHRSFLADGICHENLPGCYNTHICGFDGGDCCEDTCVGWSYADCGHDGFACRDPDSTKCDPTLTNLCVAPDTGKGKGLVPPDPSRVTCKTGESKYRLVMYDSFGDGWDSTFLTLTIDKNPSKQVFRGQLKEGAQGTEFICLNPEDTCYHVDVSGGVWGNEVSWELRPLGEGTKPFADGGAPMDCVFSLGGSCFNTCHGGANVDPNLDPDYKSYKDLFNCIEDKCFIQVGTCMSDKACKPCYSQNAPDYCFANDNFNAVIDCGLCQCTANYDGYCPSKASPGAVIPKTIPDEQPAQKACSAAETLQGSSAVLTFSNCTNFDQVAIMVTDFDENNFGALDTFEACAHSFNKDPGHGGKTALYCMSILADAMLHPEGAHKDGAPTQAISTLASLLYHNAEGFCECASAASQKCPLCPSFLKFKTLLYESIDACKALDEIDCDAWNEFYPKCKKNLDATFDSVDFKTKDQCDFVKNNCGGAGAFPAFRKLDCEKEISKTPWDFYIFYQNNCLRGSDGTPPTPVDPPSPSTLPTSNAGLTSSPTIPSGGSIQPFTPSDTAKPYVPSDDDSSASSKPYPSGGSGSEKAGSSHFWRNIIIIGILGCGAYMYFKRSNDSFAFVRYRPAPRNFGSESEMMMNGGPSISLADSGNFEPPSLPPPPSAMGHSGYP